MNNTFINIITVALIAASLCGCNGCGGKSNSMSQMTMTVNPAIFSDEDGNENGTVSFLLKGSGTATIDWGDGLQPETVTLAYEGERFTHEYFADAVLNIVITGENITGLACSEIYEYTLKTMDVSKNPALQELSCGYNGLTALDVSQNAALKKLWCYDSDLNTLDISHNPALTELYCHFNHLTVLDVSKNPALEVLHCPNNDLTALDISKNPVLKNLNCYYNGLTELDLSRNPALTDLDCSFNDLTELDVSKNPALEILVCRYNKITALITGDNPNLKNLHKGGCEGNPFLEEQELSQSRTVKYLYMAEGVNYICFDDGTLFIEIEDHDDDDYLIATGRINPEKPGDIETNDTYKEFPTHLFFNGANTRLNFFDNVGRIDWGFKIFKYYRINSRYQVTDLETATANIPANDIQSINQTCLIVIPERKTRMEELGITPEFSGVPVVEQQKRYLSFTLFDNEKIIIDTKKKQNGTVYVLLVYKKGYIPFLISVDGVGEDVTEYADAALIIEDYIYSEFVPDFEHWNIRND
jgi:hypothetical protein